MAGILATSPALRHRDRQRKDSQPSRTDRTSGCPSCSGISPGDLTGRAFRPSIGGTGIKGILQVAPVEERIETSRKLSDEAKFTTCYMCACRCGIKVHLKDGRIRSE